MTSLIQAGTHLSQVCVTSIGVCVGRLLADSILVTQTGNSSTCFVLSLDVMLPEMTGIVCGHFSILSSLKVLT